MKQYICDYMMQNRVDSREFMEDNVEIDEYIFIFLGCECDDHAELVAFFEYFYPQIQIFNLSGSREPKTKISTAEGENMISLLISWDHYDIWSLKTMKMILL